MMLILVPNIVGEFKLQEHKLENGDGLVLNDDGRLLLDVGGKKTRVHIRGFIRLNGESAEQDSQPP